VFLRGDEIGRSRLERHRGGIGADDRIPARTIGGLPRSVGRQQSGRPVSPIAQKHTRGACGELRAGQVASFRFEDDITPVSADVRNGARAIS
jgi:hypothetical protein